VPEPATDQSLTHRPSRGRQSRAEKDRRRERLHDCQDADGEADNEQHEKAALDQCHPRGIIAHSLVGRLRVLVCHDRSPPLCGINYRL
jgi:hypothetical protein